MNQQLRQSYPYLGSHDLCCLDPDVTYRWCCDSEVGSTIWEVLPERQASTESDCLRNAVTSDLPYDLSLKHSRRAADTFAGYRNEAQAQAHDPSARLGGTGGSGEKPGVQPDGRPI